MDRAEALRSLRPYEEKARDFTGWSFPKDSWKHLGPTVPWNYSQLVRDAAESAGSVLDMGTGGGEFLAQISSSLPHPPLTVATEEWRVNVPVAKKRLGKLGIETIHCKSVDLPFNRGSFDLVVNRHEELEPREVTRVLKPGGKIMTQQVGWGNWKELRTYFPSKTDFGDHRKRYAEAFRAEGLKIIEDVGHDYKVAYGNLGDFVFMLAVTPWTIPGFSLEKDIDSLLALYEGCKTENGLELTESRYLLIAEKRQRA